MKKLFALILAVAMIMSFAACGNADDSQPTGNNSGKTETKWLVKSETYVYEDPSMGTVEASFEYDSLGNVQKITQKTITGDVIIVYSYNDKNQCTGMDLTQGGLTMRTVYTLDKNGNRTKSEMYNGDTLVQSTVATFDKKGNMLTQKLTGGNYESYTEYTYDEEGKVLGYTASTNGTVTAVVTVEYDDQGRQAKATTKDASGKLISEIAVTYDGNTETQESKTAAGNVVSTTVITRDENGNVVEKSVSGSSASAYTYTATYYSIEVPVSE